MAFPRFNIRGKLLLAAASLLVVPWLGYRYVQDLESYLRESQAQASLDRAGIVAALVEQNAELRRWQSLTKPPPADAQHIYVRPLPGPIQLDGYRDEWNGYGVQQQLLGQPQQQSPSLSATYMVGTHAKHLYLFVQVRDDRVVYRPPQSLRIDRNDHLRIAIIDQDGQHRRYALATIAPGWVNAYRLRADARPPLPGEVELRIKGEWQQTAHGYDIELRVPLDMIGPRFALALVDVDAVDDAASAAVLRTGDTEAAHGLSTIALPATALDRLLATLRRPDTRIWVVDSNARVIALSGELRSQAEDGATAETGASYTQGMMRVLYRLILDQPTEVFEDELSTASSLRQDAIVQALSGSPATQWRPTADEQLSILTAAYPLHDGEHILGAVAIEQTGNSILLLQNRAVEALITLTVLAFLVVALVLLVFATRLSWRVRRLRDEVETSIARDGRIVGDIAQQRAGDEIGDLSRSFAAMLKRLGEYNRYLESMASKLSHELRTPISVVRSSLDNLDTAELDEQARTYAERAREGVERLSGLLARMSEATRLEQTIHQEAPAPFDMVALVRGCIDGYRGANPVRTFVLKTELAPDRRAMVMGSAELMAQLLDKLVENALDFAPPGTPIELTMDATEDEVSVSVANEGPQLPAEMQGRLFDSMVSLRSERGDAPHLGLGLYIARLIADYHGGRIDAHNRSGGTGVSFVVTLARSSA